MSAYTLKQQEQMFVNPKTQWVYMWVYLKATHKEQMFRNQRGKIRFKNIII